MKEKDVWRKTERGGGGGREGGQEEEKEKEEKEEEKEGRRRRRRRRRRKRRRTGGATDLCGEELALRVMTEELPLGPHVLQGEDVVEDVLAVGEELAEQQGVRHEDRQHHHHQVEELAEAEVEVVLGVPGPQAEEVPGDGGRL